MNNIEECKMVPITELLECIVDNRGKSCPTCDEGFPLIATNCIKHSSIYPTFENIRYVSDETLKTWFRAELKPNDILFVNKGTPGRVCLVPDPITFCAAQDMIGLRADSKKIYYKYLFAVLRSNFIQEKIANFHVGIAIPHFKKSDMDNLLIPVPDIYIQKKIGDMYCELSEKIENNNKINAELESMAKTIYDYWFLQFEFPNEEGKPYKSSGGKMVWNEELKREIPEGWEVNKIGNTDIYVSDYTANGSFAGLADNVKYNEGEKYALLIRPVDFNTNFEKEDSFIYVNKHGYEYLSKSKLFGDEIIICNVGAVGAVYRCPRLDIPMTLGPNGIVVNNKNYNHFISCHFKSEIGQQQLLSISSGSIQMKFNKTNFRDISIAFPTENILNEFNSLYGKLYDKQQIIWRENRELASLRDFLLPMLMNGQVGFKINNRKE